MNKPFVAFFALALCSLGSLGLSTTVSAQTAPAPAPTPVDLPSLPPNSKIDPTTQAIINAGAGIIRYQLWKLGNQSEGNVTYFKSYEMQVQTGANQYRSIHLHKGTVINPRGASIQSGQRVQVGGDAQPDGSLNANVITIVQ